VMDGIAAVTEIRRREADTGAPRTPIAILTANASEEHRGVGEAAGADCHVAKPITPETLIAGIAATLASGGRRRAATAAASVKRR
jgi:two-component system, sensor histidine kinase